MTEMTDRQKDLVDFIEDFSRDNGYTPTFREIARGIGVTIGAVQKLIAALEKKKLIKREFNRSRALRVVRKDNRIPIHAFARAGNPRVVDEEAKEYFEPNPSLGIKPGDRGIQIIGDSMIGAGITDGSTVFYRPGNEIRDGQVVVARVDDGVTVKTFTRQGKNIVLKPENPLHKPIVIDPAVDNFEIIGRVLCAVTRFGKQKKVR